MREINCVNTTVYVDENYPKGTPLCYEPKFEHRYKIIFPEECDIPDFVTYRCNKPKYYNGEWSNIVMEMYDFIGPSTSQGVHTFIQYFQKEKVNSFNIESLDPIGEVIERWIIKIDKIIKVDFGECDYSNKEISKIVIEIKPKRCILLF